MLDNKKYSSAFSWQPVWHINKAIDKTVDWTKAWLSGANVTACMLDQIDEYLQKA
jgi:CDP-glucose 4,6-dehydratase